MIGYQETPFSGFHVRVALAAAGGQFSDGYVLGTVGIALDVAHAELQLNTLWMGLLGGATLAGLFLGSLLLAPLADQYGRRPLFIPTMPAFVVVSIAQFFVHTAWQLLCLRLLLGLALGIDYVTGSSVVTEFAPHRVRSRLLSLMAVSWTAGFALAYVVGTLIASSINRPWRWILVSSAVPALIVFFLRLSIPETPPWLVQRGRVEEARAIVTKYFGCCVSLPVVEQDSATQARSAWAELFSRPYRTNTLVATTFYTAQVMPYFAMGTFISVVLATLGVTSALVGGVAFNLFLLAGSAVGVWVIDKITRRQFLMGSFYLTAITLTALVLLPSGTDKAVVVLFGLFAFVLSAAANLEYGYLPELFPTRLRASGVGLATASSRVGSALSTFLLPVCVATIGIRFTLTLCAAVLAIGGVVCQVWAPDTRCRSLE